MSTDSDRHSSDGRDMPHTVNGLAEDHGEEHKDEEEDDNNGDADSFVHRPFSPDSGAAM